MELRCRHSFRGCTVLLPYGRCQETTGYAHDQVDENGAGPSTGNRDGPARGEAGTPFGAPTPADATASASASTPVDAFTETELKDIFPVTRATCLESDEGTSADRVVAFEFDASDYLQLAFSENGGAATQSAVDDAAVEITLARYGGPVRRRTMTVVE